MNTTGIIFERKDKTYAAAPGWSGKLVLTRPFIESCIAAFKAGKSEVKIEGRNKSGAAGNWINLSFVPEKT